MSDPAKPLSSRSAPPVLDLTGGQDELRPATGNRVLIPELRGAPERPPGEQIATLGGETMGTVWTARIVVRDEAAAARWQGLIEEELERIIALFSPWDRRSEISRFNAAPAGTWALSDAFWTVLTRAMDLADETNGAVDPTLGTLVDLWGFGPPGPRSPLLPVPSDDEVEAARALSGWMQLRLHTEAHAAVQPGGLKLDLSGIAKGHAVDRISQRLAREGATSHLFEIGGELKGIGVKPDGRPWWVELETPEGLDAPRTIAALYGLAVATSGEARRQFVHGNTVYSHTIDGRSGRPVANGMVSVSVFHESAMVADALASALTVMGPGDGLAHAEISGIAALMVHRTEAGLVEQLSPACRAMLDVGR